MRQDGPNISHVYAGNPLDRGDRERRDEEWLAANARCQKKAPRLGQRKAPLVAGDRSDGYAAGLFYDTGLVEQHAQAYPLPFLGRKKPTRTI